MVEKFLSSLSPPVAAFIMVCAGGEKKNHTIQSACLPGGWMGGDRHMKPSQGA